MSQGSTSTAVTDNTGSTNPSSAGIPVTYKATITPSQSTSIEPTGTVTFYDANILVASCTSVTVVQGTSSSTAPSPVPSRALRCWWAPT